MTIDYQAILSDRTDDGVVRLLALLEGDYQPRLKRMGPLRRLPSTTPVPNVHVPTWKWTFPAAGGVDLQDAVTVDGVAAYISAASSVRVGLNRLVRGDQADDGKTPYPGWYLIDAHHWAERAIASPLGTNVQHGGQVWVAHPTLLLLRQLQDRGVWPDTYVYDCWTSAVGVRLSKWTDVIRNVRAAVIAAGDPAVIAAKQDETYEALKDGYAQAVQMILTGTKCETYRPDWAHAIRAQHSAYSTWWKAWRALECGCPPVRMISPDELTFTGEAYAALQGMQDRPLKDRPLTLDPSGLQLGAYRVKATDTAAAA